MAKILAGRFNRWAEKLFATKEGRATIDTLSPEIISVIPLFYGVECRYLEGWNRFAQLFISPAVAASNSCAELRNTVGSNILVVIESIIIDIPAAVATAIEVQVSPLTTDLSTSAQSTGRIDRRGSPASNSIASIGTGNTQGTGGTIHAVVPAAATLQLISNSNQELTILPGDALFITNGTQNQAVDVSVVWRERVLESSELS